MRAKGQLSFETDVFGTIESAGAIRSAVWDKKRKLNALSLRRIFEGVPASVPEGDETRHGVIWRHSIRDGTENWMQLE